MTPIPAHSAFHKIGLDVVGPLQRTADGNRYIITCVNYMVKWVEANVLPKHPRRLLNSYMVR